jgi:hypothetical protein
VDRKLMLVAAIWLSGFLAGLVLVARWRHMGGDGMATVPAGPAPDEAQTSDTSTVQRRVHRVTGPIAAGARADLVRVRHAATNVNRQVASVIGGVTGRS